MASCRYLGSIHSSDVEHNQHVNERTACMYRPSCRYWTKHEYLIRMV